MKHNIIVGYNDFSKKIIDKINNVKVILDDLTSDVDYMGIKIDNIKNINYYLDECTEIYIIDDMPYFDEIYHKLYEQNINKINVIIKENVDVIDENVLNSENIQVYYLKNKPLLRYIETHISDKCNLRCNGCTHFSNISENDYVNINNFKKDMDALKSKFDVSVIRLMGGEPLLKKDLHEYIEYTRMCFPSSTIFLVTNGLLIKSLNDININSIKKNNVIINISLYKPTLKIIDNIENFLNKHEIKHRFGRGNVKPIQDDYIVKFHTCLDETKITRNEKLNCYNQYCWFLRNESIYKCPYPALIDILNKKYDLDFKLINHYVDIKSINNGWETIRYLSDKIDFCDYCRNSVKTYDWNNNSPELCDYLLGGKDGNIKD